MTAKLLIVATILLASPLAGCDNSSFSGSSASPTTAPPKKTVPEAKVAPTTTRPPASDIDSGELVADGGESSHPVDLAAAACTTQSTALAANAGIGGHQDSNAASRNRYGDSGMPVADVAESAVVSFDLKAIDGNLLPVSNFALDDVAFIVKPATTVAQVLACGDCSQSRTIRVPADAILLFDASDPNYASGSMDSRADTNYVFADGKSAFLPGDGHGRPLRSVYGFGSNLVGHNKIALQDLKAKGFVDASGKVSFKVMNVAHGAGSLVLTFDLKPCR